MDDIIVIDDFLNEEELTMAGDLSTYTYSGISVLSPELFQNIDIPKFGLWEEVLLPASINNLVSGELFEGLLDNLNTLEEAEKLDALLS